MMNNSDIVHSAVVIVLLFLLFSVPALLFHLAGTRRPHRRGPWARLYDRELH
jgi:hypothetical protein